MKNPFHELDRHITGILNYPGCNDKKLIGHKSIWKSTAFAFSHSLLLTVGFLIFAPQLTILIHYGFSLILLFTVTLPLFLIFPRYFMVVGFSQGLTFNLITFYFILMLGGIPTSGGLIFVGITIALSTVPLQMAWYSVMMFSIYIILVIFMVLLKPWVHVPEQMTPALNSAVYLINTLSMTGLSLLLVLNFIRQQRKLDDMEANKLKEINQIKNKLFTNITHEFRTPLTVILGMSDLIEKNPEEWVKEGTTKIRNNSNVLLKLVNQMLDLDKIEAGVMPVRLVQGDISAFIRYITELFSSVARIRMIRLSADIHPKPFLMDYDPDKLLHILSNLISNALKFTEEGGTVHISAYPEDESDIYIVQVSDTGIGIHPDHLAHVFDRFFQGNNTTGFQQGTGLGLFHAKELVELLKGRITAESQPGNGTTFTVRLPVNNQAAPEISLDSEKLEKQVSTFLPEKTELPVSAGEDLNAVQELPLMLIVEDSVDVSCYLTALMKNDYQIELAGNGKIGLEKAIRMVPDIILSDVMMPEMDGTEFLEKVKNDIRTSHIPVVMLTAKADTDSRLEGLERGADAYLAKPFDEKELRIQLKNLVAIRRKLYERYALADKIPESPDPTLKMEDAFMMKVKKVLESNLEDDEFGINQLCHELCVSHAQLYRKFKSLSNITIADFFKSLRLHRAKELLQTTDMNVTEITFAVGFKNLSHFSREFSREFGKSPSEFKVKG